jgi:hypothetical protein
MGQNRSSAVMAARREPKDALDYFPTPPWATRALCEFLRRDGAIDRGTSVWEPACGAGHMSRPLAEYFAKVWSSDVEDRGFGEVRDFLWPGDDPRADWIVTNPPFRLADQFALKALNSGAAGVALLTRTVFVEGAGRFWDLFHPHPPSDILQFSERVPMVKDKLDEDASTATAYAWIVWRGHPQETRFRWVGPCRKRLERQGDYAAVGAHPVLRQAQDEVVGGRPSSRACRGTAVTKPLDSALSIPMAEASR